MIRSSAALDKLIIGRSFRSAMFGRSSFTLAAIVFLFGYGQFVAAKPNSGSRENRRPVGIDTTFGEVVHQARIALQRKKYDEAIAKLTTALEMKPDPKNAALVYSLRAEAFVWKNDLAKAQQDAEASIRFDPNFADGHFKRGLVYRMREDNDRAIAEYTTAIRLNPGFVMAYSNRGVAYCHSFQFENAIRDFNEALRRDPNCVDALMNRGIAYETLGQRDKALTDYEAIRRKPDIENAHYNRGGLLFSMGDYARALGDLNEAIRQNPRSLQMRVARATLYEKLNMTDQSLAEYRAATTLAPSNAEERVTRGLAFFTLGDYRLAANDFALAKHELPRSSDVLGASAWFKATCPEAAFRNGPEALRESRRACELTKWKDADKLDTYAAACAEVGNYEDALKYEAQAIKLRGSSASQEMEKHLHCYQQRRPYREKPGLRG